MIRAPVAKIPNPASALKQALCVAELDVRV